MSIDMFLGQLASVLLVALMCAAVRILFMFEANMQLGFIGGIAVFLAGGAVGFLVAVLYYESQKSKEKDSVIQSEV